MVFKTKLKHGTKWIRNHKLITNNKNLNFTLTDFLM